MFCDNGCITIFDNKKVNIINKKSPCVNKRIATNPLGIRMPDGHILYFSHTALLPQDTLPIEALYAHVFPDLKNKALLSIGMLCDNGYLALFDDKKVHIINKKTNKHIMHGTCDNQSSLYMVPLTPKQNENMTNSKFLSVTLPVVYMSPNQKLIYVPFSTSRCGARAHSH